MKHRGRRRKSLDTVRRQNNGRSFTERRMKVEHIKSLEKNEPKAVFGEVEYQVGVELLPHRIIIVKHKIRLS